MAASKPVQDGSDGQMGSPRHEGCAAHGEQASPGYGLGGERIGTRQLECFAAVAHEGGFTQAAAMLGISQAAVTKQVRLLEKRLGINLVDRSTRPVTLTDVGRQLLPLAIKAIGSLEETTRDILAYVRGEAGPLRVGFLRNCDPQLLVQTFAPFLRANPGISFEPRSASSHELLLMAEQGRIDAFVCMETHENSTLEHYRLRSYPLVVLLPKSSPLAQKDVVGDQDLENVLFDVRDLPYGDERSPEFEGNLLRIACGMGCAVLHSFTGNNCYDEYVVSRPLRPRVETSICLFFSSDLRSPAAEALRRSLG
jgi:DNA-binding transcriptional LysR family regulator